MLKCVRCSVSDSVPLPISSMSGSFQAPGPAAGASGMFLAMRDLMRAQSGWISPVVRQRLPTAPDHFEGLPAKSPFSHSE